MNERREAPRTPRKRRKRNPVLTVLKVLGTLCVIGVLTAVMFFGIFMKYVNTTIIPIADVDASAYTLNQSSVIYYQDKQSGEWVELQKVHGVENRTLITYAEIPDYVWKALVAIEDQRFFEHNGVDWKSTGKAVLQMLTGSDDQRGGSTLTQQVIKNLTGENETTVKRKITEIFRALRFAENYSREEVLTMYLNLVYFGKGAYGISAAAESYFGKEVSELTVAEAASIIGITQYPYKYDPSRGDWYREQNKKRQLDVLYKMNEQGYLTDAEYEAAKAEELVFVWDEDYVETAADVTDGADEQTVEETTSAQNYDPYIVEQVINDVVADLMAQKGYSKKSAQDLIYTGGYKIYATLDPELQAIVEEVYGNVENLPYTSAKGEQLQSGITVIDNATGNIVAMGGRIGERDGAFLLNYATNPRPCGSAIKPLSTYAPALETGILTPASVVDDYPVRLQMNDEDDLKAWPKNSYTGYRGFITLQTAIRVSTNTTAVRTLEALGPSASYSFLTEKLGLTTLVNDDLNSAALALGGFTYGVSTAEMAAAYATFANAGVYTKPRTYVAVYDNNGNLILENQQESWVAMKESTAYSMNEMLKGVVRSGTGTSAAFSGMTIAGKTGTTSNNYDRYFVGYTPYYTAAVWIGYDLPSRISASGNPAAVLWKSVMSQVHENLPNQDFPAGPDSMVEVTVCTRTGLLAGPNCTETQTVKVASGMAPVLTCDAHVTLNICTESGCLASSGCPAECVTVVDAIDLQSENLTVADGGYVRSLIQEPPTQKERDAYNAQLASLGEGETMEPLADKIIYADDYQRVLQDMTIKGICTTHVAIEEPTSEGYYDEFGNWIEPTSEVPADGEGEANPNASVDDAEAPADPETDTAQDQRAFLDWLTNAA